MTRASRKGKSHDHLMPATTIVSYGGDRQKDVCFSKMLKNPPAEEDRFLVYLVCFVWLNDTHQINQINQINKTTK
jgi:hypothetical protein